jgi:hypothetical protein
VASLPKSALLVLTLCGLGACTRSREVVITNELEPAAPMTVLVFGEDAGKATAGEIRVKVPTKASHRNADGTRTTACLLPGCGREGSTDALTVRVETSACGLVELCVGFPQDEQAPLPPDGKPLHGRLLTRKREQFSLCTDEYVGIWVDNRGGPERTLAAGKGPPHRVPADSAARIQVPAPPCDAASTVTVDGETIGSLPVFASDAGYQELKPRDVVVDPTAARCYVAGRVEYTPTGHSSSGPSSGTPLDRQRLHVLPFALDSFLVQSPDTVQGYAGFASRTQAVEVPCEQPPR